MLHFIAIFVGWSLLALLDEISVDTEVVVSGVAVAGNDNAAVSAAIDNLDKLIFIVFPLKYAHLQCSLNLSWGRYIYFQEYSYTIALSN